MTTIRPNPKDREALLQDKSVERVVRETAEQLADEMRSAAIYVEGIPGDMPLPIGVDVYRTDRVRASVTIEHPAGLAVAAKHGLHHKAAAALGLKIGRES